MWGLWSCIQIFRLLRMGKIILQKSQLFSFVFLLFQAISCAVLIQIVPILSGCTRHHLVVTFYSLVLRLSKVVSNLLSMKANQAVDSKCYQMLCTYMWVLSLLFMHVDIYITHLGPLLVLSCYSLCNRHVKNTEQSLWLTDQWKLFSGGGFLAFSFLCGICVSCCLPDAVGLTDQVS